MERSLNVTKTLAHTPKIFFSYKTTRKLIKKVILIMEQHITAALAKIWGKNPGRTYVTEIGLF